MHIIKKRCKSSSMDISKRLLKEKDLLALSAYQKELQNKPQLRALFFELTDACNLNCLHCGSGCSSKNRNMLDFDVVEHTLLSVAQAYGPNECMVNITGGEPLLYPRLNDVIALAHSLGFAVGITTNGTLISPFAARQLARSGLDTIAVSLDGIGETHDEFRKTKGCFQRALDGINALKCAGIEPEVLTVVHKYNLNQLDALFSLLTELDLYSWRLVSMDPIGRANIHRDLLLSGNELEELYQFIRKKRYDHMVAMEVSYGCAHYVTYRYEREIRDYYFQCGAGTQVGSIAANGDILACLDIERRPELVQGNAYRDDFVQIWEREFKPFRIDRTKNSMVCCKCEHRSVCLGDAAHTWDYEKNEPLYCVSKMIDGGKK